MPCTEDEDVMQQSRRSVINRSAYGFCMGDRGEIGRSRIPIARTFQRKVGPYEKSVTVREVLDAMWLLKDKFEQALSKFNEIKASQNGQHAR